MVNVPKYDENGTSRKEENQTRTRLVVSSHRLSPSNPVNKGVIIYFYFCNGQFGENQHIIVIIGGISQGRDKSFPIFGERLPSHAMNDGKLSGQVSR